VSVFKVDSNGALVRSGGAFVRVAGVEEIAQGLQVRPLIVRGEIPTATDRGLPWFEVAGSDAPALLGKSTPPTLLGARVRAALEAVPGVVEVVSLTVEDDPDNADGVRIFYAVRVSTADLQSELLAGQLSVG
jgi:hypothetical protein